MKITYLLACSVESGRQQEPKVKTRCRKDGVSCIETKHVMSESSELVKKSVLFSLVQACNTLSSTFSKVLVYLTLKLFNSGSHICFIFPRNDDNNDNYHY